MAVGVLFIEILVCILIVGSSTDGEIPCPQNCQCRTVNSMNCQNVSSVPHFNGSEDIRELTIKNHSISTIRAGDFANFTSLSQLSMLYGNITNISADAFVELRNTLTRLQLNSNKITQLDKNTITNFTELTGLDLNFNRIAKIESGSLTNLPKLVSLRLEFNEIEKIEPDACIDTPLLETVELYTNKLTAIPWDGFRAVKGLKILNVKRNKITHVEEDTGVFFDSLEEIHASENPIWNLATFPNVSNALKILDLGFTRMDSVGKHTWKKVPQLERLFLEGTEFYELTKGMFEGLSELQALFMTDMPNLRIVGPHAFAGLDKIHSIDISRNKKLSEIHEDAFVDTHVATVKLFDGGLKTISEKLFRWKEMAVFLAPNPITCDCRMRWAANASVFGNDTDIDQLRCSLPEKLEGHRVISLNPGSFICIKQDDHKKRFATGLVVAIVVAVFFTTLALVFKFRHQISMKCRRYFQYRRYRNDMIFTVENDTAVADLDDTESRPLQNMRLETVPLEENA